MEQPTQQEVPEPEFLIFFFVTGLIFTVAFVVAALLFSAGRRRRSIILQVLAGLVFSGGAVVFVPAGYLAILWFVYWVVHSA